MAPVRRYLRISKYSVLECRIYLDNPALAHSWLLHPRDPVLPKVIEAVRPYVLPKLREERERSRKKNAKKRGIKDTITQDDFEVSVFLTETSTRHSLLFKHKHFQDTAQTKLTSNASKLTGNGASWDVPIDVEQQLHQQQRRQDHDSGPSPPTAVPAGLRIEENDDEDDVVALYDIPTRVQDETTAAASPRSSETQIRRPGGGRPRRGRNDMESGARDSSALDNANKRLASDDSDRQAGSGSGSGSNLDHQRYEHGHDHDEVGDGDSSLFVDQHQELAESIPAGMPGKQGANDARGHVHGFDDDKKKLAMDISYEGFSIYGRVLCLVVKRREGSTGGGGIGATGARGGKGKGVASASQSSRAPGGQATMANWIASTQVPDTAEGALLGT